MGLEGRGGCTTSLQVASASPYHANAYLGKEANKAGLVACCLSFNILCDFVLNSQGNLVDIGWQEASGHLRFRLPGWQRRQAFLLLKAFCSRKLLECSEVFQGDLRML